jgi:hypothetical protein
VSEGAGALQGARARLGRAQAELLGALVAGAPAPSGFDPARLRVQARALRAKRADVVAKVAPELPELVGGEAEYRRLFAEYATRRAMEANYRWDALQFAAYVLKEQRRVLPRGRRRELKRWYRHRAGPAPR